MEKIFRYSIKAVIIRDGKLLVESATTAAAVSANCPAAATSGAKPWNRL